MNDQLLSIFVGVEDLPLSLSRLIESSSLDFDGESGFKNPEPELSNDLT